MNDLVLLGIVLGSLVFGTFLILLYSIKDSRQEFKMFQMENTRLIQQMDKTAERHYAAAMQNHEDTIAYIKAMGIRLEQVFERVDKPPTT
jgi:Flp pilus assembly protein protease CpaA